MNFEFSDDEQQLSEAVQRWVERGYGFERRTAIARAGGFSAEAWGEIAELGLLGLGTSEDDGGMAMGPVAAMLALEALGRGLVLEPVAAVALVAASVMAQAPADVRANWAPRIASGEARVVLAYQERAARYKLNRVDTKATQAGDAWTLSGTKSLVTIGDQADAFIVSARVSGAADDAAGIALFLVERGASGVKTQGYALQDGSRAAEVTLADSPATLLVAAGPAFAALELAIDIGIAALAAEAVGAMDKLFELTVDYLNTRKQFGVAIGTFQALRHRLADMKMQLELARSMSYYATLKLGEAPDVRRRAVAQAKVQLGNSARFLGQQAIQLHGGIGMTDEYIGSHYFKRLTTMEMQFGDTMHHIGEVSARMLDTAGVFA
ncbi:acyl-CoA dehydrogenase family protein [Scleromatobacter humisilvae]|uniref:Acyl-CoA dehydrogenase family protein n=1 Tax=Scleromatobacter humisilvae TaxID=2897159 RepID=A0A9X1YGP5_9BURK|nr:acyl-CoA dehydrogenase family protein [Scleromatobacter humisilvae]MCK9684373.1 acyl-CoA dehydrogenase family protein [Scleromatobacter humisilvae]